LAELIRGRYEPLELVTEGGQSRVYMSLDQLHGRKVALKVRDLAADDDLGVLLAEARMLLQLEPHRALPTVRDDFVLGDHYYLVIDWIEGSSLQKVLEQRGDPGIPVATVIGYLEQAADAIDHLHRQDPPVVHGDVKPANLILNAKGRVFLVDFGIAVNPGSELSAGTRGFVAPEVAAGGPTTTASDIYALAATAYALLSGSPPTGDAPTWTGIQQAQAENLEHALRLALSTDPERRPGTGLELVERLKGWLGPAEAQPEAAPSPAIGETAPKSPSDRTARLEERRVVTVLFADAVGSTALAEKTDEEKMYRFMQGCLSRMVEAVEQRDGTVTQFLGDGIMALFGAPVANEDSARLAVSAALRMQQSLHDYAAQAHEAIGVECRFRVGLNSGPVVVGKMSQEVPMDYTAIGDTVNVASRMQKMAKPGTVCISEKTYELVQAYFDCEPLGARRAKGKAAPVKAYRPLRPTSLRTRFEMAKQRGLTPFVGRQDELATLRGYLERVRAGQGQVVLVTADAGMGKSRLLTELRRSLAVEDVAWLEGQCLSYGSGIAYLPIIEIVTREFGIEEGDESGRIAAAVESGTVGWEAGERATLPFLKYLLNVDPADSAILQMDPRERQAGILDAVRALLIEKARSRPVVVAVEDLHWIDEQSEDLLAAVVDLVSTLPILLLLTARPGHVHRLGERTFFNQLSVTRLSGEETLSIAKSVLGASQLPEDVERLLISRVEGNPLFGEEISRSLLERGEVQTRDGSLVLNQPLDVTRVPSTIQDVILSRIDRLPAQAKEAMQLASVIGREFTIRLVERLSEPESKLPAALAELKRLELIFEKAYFPELIYMFKHALTHDVAYSTLLLDRRQQLHRLVGLAIEELYADRLVEQVETLAHHYFRAGDWPRALDYNVRAGDKSADVFANAEALGFYARALEVCQQIGDEADDTVISIVMKREGIHRAIGDYAAAVEDTDLMLTLARRLGYGWFEGNALCIRGLAQYWLHQPDSAEATLRAALELGEKEDFDDIRFAAASLLSLVLNTYGRSGAEGPHQLAVQLQSSAGDVTLKAWFECVESITSNWAGQFAKAVVSIRQSQETVRASSSRAVLGVVTNWIEGLALGGNGEYSSALAVLERSIADADRIGEHDTRARCFNTIGWIHSELEDHVGALEWNARGLDAAALVTTADAELESNCLLNICDNLLALGRLDDAEARLKKVELVVRGRGDRWMQWRYSQHFFHSSGELCLARSDNEQALTLADECLALATSTDSLKNVVKARRLRGQALAARGRGDEALQELQRASQLAGQVGNPPQIWKTQAALGDLLLAQGRRAEAAQALQWALAVIDDVAAELTNPELRDSLLQSSMAGRLRSGVLA
jgi:class 3 adenylate cyclase/tetratricopeptide (TPR) repeat protein